eukprot:TRINITY_DN72389_c0_g1_i1.p1 TRINITY_DN72389_c0_g1~~TRINITY_DN72389_c0_g1_i1.p1  ORF type:complete len:806 (+),score=220.77 TRINITY_DN72389_c0_g1_i1:92-2509(+)
MTKEQSMPFFAREKEHLKLFAFNKQGEVEEQQTTPFPLPTPKAACWSPDGLAVAMVDPNNGPQVVVFEKRDRTAGATVLTLPGAPKTVQSFLWSPLGSIVVSLAPTGKGAQEPNIHVWRRAGAGTPGSGAAVGGAYELQASFVHPKLEKDKKVVQWTLDENLCARLSPDGKIHLLDGADLSESLMELKIANIEDFAFAPLDPKDGFHARLAVFVPDSRDDLQRIVGPAEVTIIELTATQAGLHDRPSAKMSVESGQTAELMWNAAGTCLLAHCQTEVDDSGQSYYGGSRLVLMSWGGETKKDLTAEESSSNGSSVQAIQWSPVRDEFILIFGFQPAKASLYAWNEATKKVQLKKVLLDKAHRNTIRFNSFGSLVALAGFGNLAGGMDFFGRDEQQGFVHVASATANCTVEAEWAADGRHFLTAVVAPRMRVDNGITIWNALHGSKVTELQFEELFDAQWQPEPGNNRTDITAAEIEDACKEDTKNASEAAASKKQAYRPPRARGDSANMVAQMMKGEIAAPENDDRRARKPRQQRVREEDHEEEASEQPPDPQPPSQRPPPPPEAPAPPPPPQAPGRSAAEAQAVQAAQARAQAEAEARAAAEAQYRAQAEREQREQREREAAAIAAMNASAGRGYPSAGGQSAQQQRQPLPQGQQQAQQAQQQAQAQAQAQAQQRAQQQKVQQAQLQQQQQLQQAQLLQQQKAQQQAQAHQAQQQRAAAEMQSHGAKMQCPTTGWQYVDPKGQIQGPFTLLEMQQWYYMNYFRPELPMRCSPNDSFVPFSELFPHPLVPFQSYPKRPQQQQMRR